MSLLLLLPFLMVAAAYEKIVSGTPISHRLSYREGSNTVTYQYDSDITERYMSVQLTYVLDREKAYPDPLLMVAQGMVPYIFYDDNQFTTNATYYDQEAFQLVKLYHFVVVPKAAMKPGPWYITVTNLPVWSKNELSFDLLLSIEDSFPCPVACSGHGTCQADGTCRCSENWGDKDCSVPMTRLALDRQVNAKLSVGEWKYYYLSSPSGAGDASSFIFAEMEITSEPRCDAILYFKHEDDGFTNLPTHYDFQYHSDSRSFYAYRYDYHVIDQPIRDGKYIVAVYNYDGRGIESECGITVHAAACYTGSCEHTKDPSMHTTSSWFFGLFVLAGLPLFCFIPFFFCIRRLRLAQRDGGRGAIGLRAAAIARLGRPGGAPLPAPGLTAAEIASLDEFLCEEDGDDACSVCLGNFQAGEEMRRMYCRHIFHKDCIDEWLMRQRVCPLCKADALTRPTHTSGSMGVGGGATRELTVVWSVQNFVR